MIIPDGLDILQRHYRQSERPGMGFSKARPAFVCLAHQDGTNPGMFLKKRDGEWWAVHYEAGSCPSERLPAPMSDEHKRQTDYWARAAQDAGWRVELEHALPTRTRPDALIHGPVMTGVEVQRSSMTAVIHPGEPGEPEGMIPSVNPLARRLGPSLAVRGKPITAGSRGADRRS